MCEIAGVLTRGAAPPREVIGAMCAVMRHRGPDGEGVHIEAGIGLGMRRLAVLDLLTGDQRHKASIERPGVRAHAT